MRIPIQQGRAFAETDRLGAPEVVIVNENMARRLFGDVNPVGHVLRFPNNRGATIVGIARNSKYVTLGEDNALAVYAPHVQQKYEAFAHFFVRTKGSPDAMVRTVDAALGELDPVASVETRLMRDVFAASLLPSRVGAAVLGSMALFGLLLASIGLYGVLVYAIQQRVREIGLRVALGATPADVFRMVGGQSLRLVVTGMAIGLALAMVAVRPLSMFLVPEVRPADPTNFVVVAGVLALVAGLATVAPVVRALRVDPAVALRVD